MTDEQRQHAVAAIQQALPALEWTLQPAKIKRLSRDFHWFSPLLTEQLAGKQADAVVRPRDEEELRQLVCACAQHQLPLTLRGSATGNYGQLVPLEGGLLVDMTGLNQIVALGNGTASRETEAMVCELLRQKHGAAYMIVSEAGASVYSASPLAAEEFPQYDVNLRSAVSIARRLQDPLAELVKIDPKAVGVGQYQHDMPQKRLNETLDGVVEDCVNSVGVDLNTASAPLLARVAGITNATAKNIVAWREEEGAFTSRAQLKKVKGLGPKAFEQCAGFLRLPGAKNPLDATAVHPESYAAAKALLDACGYTAAEIGTDRLAGLPGAVKAKGAGTLCALLGVGEPTLNDIVAELCKPGRDVRDSLPKPLLRSDVMGLDDLKPGMELTGTVRNVIDFGAFVDIGVHQDGLVHISQMTDRYIKHPLEAVSVGDIVEVKVLGVDMAKKRISLTMKL